MTGKWIELVTGSLDQKKRYRADRSRLADLPGPYAGAAQAVHRYLMYYSGITDGGATVAMLSDLADLFERAAADSTPIREIVGDDPVGFAETFSQAYTASHWIDKERARLATAIDQAEQEQQ